MEKPLQSIINRGFRNEMDSLFGLGSRVSITQIIYSTQNKSVVIHAKLFVSDLDLNHEIYPDGLDLLISEAWKMFSIDCRVRLVHSLELIQNIN